MRISACLAAATVIAFAPPTHAQKYIVEPGKVFDTSRTVPGPSGQTLVPGYVSATFALKQSAAGDDPILLPGNVRGVSGGACLLYQPAANPKPCNSDDECEIQTGRYAVINGYCLTNIGPTYMGPKKTCWNKRSESWCVKRPTTPLKEDKAVYLPKVPAYPIGKTGVLWIVLTCQNLRVDLANDFIGCRQGEKDVDFRIRRGPLFGSNWDPPTP